MALAIAAAACASGSRFERTRPREVLVEVLPRSAEVLLDGKPVGRGPGTFPAASRDLGGHTVAFRAPGFVPEELVLPAGDVAGARLGAALRPEGFPGPPLDLEDAPGLAAAAEFLGDQGDAADARDYAERAAMVDPRLAEAHRALGDARARLGDGAGAAESWGEYLRLAPAAEDAAAVEARIEQARSGGGDPAAR
ncbi:hypothetical protein AMOR_08370 [Anaeromyxobacter oryzae]|uniref:PEGA domain-containing protein n=1 Tax=Anaeromyxobacter oryzae TaxID=2918170 RepID=A0ABM7WQV6_9BACT|nr:hypothetical protein AMOR_08370 [Anaeromyxobacter oryzae]